MFLLCRLVDYRATIGRLSRDHRGLSGATGRLPAAWPLPSTYEARRVRNGSAAKVQRAEACRPNARLLRGAGIRLAVLNMRDFGRRHGCANMIAANSGVLELRHLRDTRRFSSLTLCLLSICLSRCSRNRTNRCKQNNREAEHGLLFHFEFLQHRLIWFYRFRIAIANRWSES